MTFQEARDWIFRSGFRCPLAFENVCDALGIDTQALRERVSAMIYRGAEANISPLRLRLKEASRVQRLTVNRVRRRNNRRPRLKVRTA